MPDEADFSEINAGKKTFDDIYNRPDPRDYYRELGQLGYAIPTRAKPVFKAMLEGLREARRISMPSVLDLGCSYGVNAAMMKYDLEFEDLAARYADPRRADASTAEVIIEDAEFFGEHLLAEPVAVVGADVADEAVGYARAVGIIDDGFCDNLEAVPPGPAAAALIRGIDMVSSTGCVGYVTERSFRRILDAAGDGELPWIASFVLRMFPYDAICDTLAAAGYVTERLDGLAFTQRRFASENERNHVLAAVESLGRDPRGLEDQGRHYAEFFLSRPEAEAEALPLAEIVRSRIPDLIAQKIAAPALG